MIAIITRLKIDEDIERNIAGAQELKDFIETMYPKYADQFLKIIGPFMSELGDDALERSDAYIKMLTMAKITERGIDISGVFRECDTITESALQNLPKLKSIAEYERDEAMKNVILKHVFKVDEFDYLPHLYYISNNGTNPWHMPMQGWKLHISANDMADYARLITSLCPDLDKMGVPFKVLNPDRFEDQMNSDQRGKLFTIYITPEFDFDKLSPESKEILKEKSIAPINEMQFDGRVFGRYGRCAGEIGDVESMIGRDGVPMKDLRHVADAPNFVCEKTLSEIFNFYKDCESRYQVHGDLRRYIMESVLMTNLESMKEMIESMSIMGISPEHADYLLRDIKTRDSACLGSIFQCGDQAYLIANSALRSRVESRLTLSDEGYVYITDNDEYVHVVTPFNRFDPPELKCIYAIDELDNINLSQLREALRDNDGQLFKMEDGTIICAVNRSYANYFLEDCEHYNVGGKFSLMHSKFSSDDLKQFEETSIEAIQKHDGPEIK